jgi:hypothetical protein
MNGENKRMAELHADTTATPPSCARADDLVAYLYGEASQTAANDFEAHAAHCDSCRTELAAFGQVRGSIHEWRQLVLGSHEPEAAAVPFSERSGVTPSRRRSALAALREFFALSPVWMRAGVALASFGMCALALMAIAQAEVRWDASGLSFRTGVGRERVVERTRTVEVEKPVPVGYSQAELEQAVAERVRQEREAWQKEQPPVKFINTKATPRMTTARNAPQPSGDVTPRNPSRQALAQRNGEGEEDLPRLYDLLDESN